MIGTSREECAGSTIPVLKLGGSPAPSSGPFRLAHVSSARDKILCRQYHHSYLIHDPYISVIYTCSYTSYMISIQCMCRAFAAALTLCYGYVPLHLVALCCLCWFSSSVSFVVVYGPSLRVGRGIVPRSNVSVVGSSRRGHDAECNSFPHVLVVSVILRSLATLLPPRTWPLQTQHRCGYHPHTTSPL